MECDVYIESVFFSLFRNWNLEPCLKVGGIVLFAKFIDYQDEKFLTLLEDENRIRTHINSNIYYGIEEIKKGVEKYPEKDVLNFNQFENKISYSIVYSSKYLIKEKTGSEAIWFLDRKMKIEEFN